MTTIADIRARHPLFFSKGAMRFFRSKIERKVYEGPGGVFFVTSEQFSDTAPRRWTVRQEVNGDIRTIHKFNALFDRDDARALAKRLASGVPLADALKGIA